MPRGPMRKVWMVAAALLCACGVAKQPPTREVVHLYGSPYERGKQHGELLASKVKSFYATMLTNSLLPYLGREQPDIASFLREYAKPEYAPERFGFRLLLDSAKSIERTMPRAVREELQGIADGSGLTYDEVLVLNTFVDTTLAVRGIALAIRLGRAPVLDKVEFLGAAQDGVDNDADGVVDEADEDVLSPWIPSLRAAVVGLPRQVAFRLTLRDADGVDPDTLRLLLDGVLYQAGDAAVTLETPTPDALVVTLRPPAPFAPGAVGTLVVGAGDTRVLDNPAPSHASFMRDEEILFTVLPAGGAAAVPAPETVRRPRLTDGRTRPPPVAVALRGPATASREPLLGHHFALLDANTAHKHTVVFVHHPDNAPPFAVVGWAGVMWGLSGLNGQGVGYACNPADTLDNTVVGGLLENIADLAKARLLARGTPIGVAGRRVLESASDAVDGREVLKGLKHIYGWSCALADGHGGLEAVETDGDAFVEGQGGVYPFGPQDTDANGRLLASLRGDELVLGSSASRNVEDITTLLVAGQRIVPGRRWSGFFFRSRRAIDAAFRQVEAGYGALDVPALQRMLGGDELVDRSDSMNAVVLEPARRRLHTAMGTVPATESPWEAVDLEEAP